MFDRFGMGRGEGRRKIYLTLTGTETRNPPRSSADKGSSMQTKQSVLLTLGLIPSHTLPGAGSYACTMASVHRKTVALDWQS